MTLALCLSKCDNSIPITTQTEHSRTESDASRNLFLLQQKKNILTVIITVVSSTYRPCMSNLLSNGSFLKDKPDSPILDFMQPSPLPRRGLIHWSDFSLCSGLSQTELVPLHATVIAQGGRSLGIRTVPGM